MRILLFGLGGSNSLLDDGEGSSALPRGTLGGIPRIEPDESKVLVGCGLPPFDLQGLHMNVRVGLQLKTSEHYVDSLTISAGNVELFTAPPTSGRHDPPLNELQRTPNDHTRLGQGAVIQCIATQRIFQGLFVLSIGNNCDRVRTEGKELVCEPGNQLLLHFLEESPSATCLAECGGPRELSLREEFHSSSCCIQICGLDHRSDGSVHCFIDHLCEARVYSLFTGDQRKGCGNLKEHFFAKVRCRGVARMW
mmetsp:Transcript_52997/g.103665  ORF Transcript_52997/g.103665 Transcript_52997/m.103665 type:complete len:251 (+) Transcript_52997:3456-4208(+)